MILNYCTVSSQLHRSSLYLNTNFSLTVFTEVVRLFDGSTSLKKRQYRSVSIPRNAPAQVLLEAALRTFHIADDPKDYYLTETTENTGW